MQRVTEPELMDEPSQAEAYAAADFAEAHERIVEGFAVYFPGVEVAGHVLDLGCGPGDISFRFAVRFPGASVTGVDGSPAMIELARQRQARETGSGDRVRFIEALIPEAPLPAGPYAAIISNSLLHHLHDPLVLWRSVREAAKPGAIVLVMDLMRPPSAMWAESLVAAYAADAPEVLRKDFRNSLFAAFEPREVVAQLEEAGLSGLEVGVVSDRHLAVLGRLA